MCFGYFSQLNYDMLSTHSWNRMNLHMNQMFAHSNVWNNMFTVPTHNLGGFTPYNHMSMNNSYLLDPRYTIMQTSFGTPGNTMPWSMNNNNMLGYWGFNFNNTSSSSSSSSSTDPEEVACNEKYNILIPIVDALIESGDLNIDQKSELVAAKNKPGNQKERYAALKAAFEKIDDEVVRQILINSDIKINGSDSFKKRLQKAGYDIQTDLDDNLNTYKNMINNTNKDNVSTIMIFASDVQKGSPDILDLVTSWNKKYPDTDLMRMLYNKMSSTELKDYYDEVIAPIAEALINEANVLKRGQNTDIYNEIEKRINNLSTKLSLKTDIAIEFNKLYELTKYVAIAKLNKDIENCYDGIDDLFKNMFTENSSDESNDRAIINDSVVTSSTVTSESGQDSNRYTWTDEYGIKHETPAGTAWRYGNEVANTMQDKKCKNSSVGTMERWINELDRTTIIAFLDGFYNNEKCKHKNIIWLLESGADIDATTNKKIVLKTLEAAQDLGLSDTLEYKKLKEKIDYIGHEKGKLNKTDKASGKQRDIILSELLLDLYKIIKKKQGA